MIIFKFKNIILSFFLGIFLFQNCAPFESFEVQSLYAYSSKPDFFSEMQVVRTEVDNFGRQLYVLDLALSYAVSPDQEVTYRVDFSTLAQSGICSPASGKATNQNSHVRVQCKLPIEDDIYVRLVMDGPNDSNGSREFRF